MNVKLKAKVKVDGDWKGSGDVVELPDKEAHRLIEIGAAESIGNIPTAAQASEAELDALRAEIARLQEFERQQLAAAAEAEAKARIQKEEAERKAVDDAAAKGKEKAGAKGDADGQAAGK